MTSGAEIVAFGAVSPLGRGEAALGAGAVGETARTASFLSPELAAAGLARPFAAEVTGFPSTPARPAAILAAALDDVIRALDVQRPGWRDERIGLVVGTSSGAMRRVEGIARSMQDGEPVDARTASAVLYASPLHEALQEAGIAVFAPFSLVLGACASSTVAVGLGLRWLEAGDCDVVLAGGFDAQSILVSAGFEALHATTSAPPPRPFHPARDGLALGEGAAFVALVPARPSGEGRRAVIGFGATCDAFHVTAPDRQGEGLGRAADRALADAGVSGRDVDLVSAHGTATSFNDAAEALALARVCQRDVGPASSEGPDIHAYKSQSGHTLGASGVLELLAADRALERQIVPASAGIDVAKDAAGTAGTLPEVRLSARAHPATLRHVLKLSAAFGGANAALVLGPSDARTGRRQAVAPLRPVYVEDAVFVALDAELPALNEIKLARFDALTRGTVAALRALQVRLASRGSGLGLPGGARDDVGLVVGHTLATFETNVSYAERIHARGARAAEPRRFPYTSPNACAGEAAIAFGLRGPVFAVGGGWSGGLEALATASTLLAAGDAESILVVAVDAPGAAWSRLGEPVHVPPGAVALLVTAGTREPAWSPWRGTLRVSANETRFERAAASDRAVLPGHLALLPLVERAARPSPGERGEVRLESRCPSGAIARVRLDPV